MGRLIKQIAALAGLMLGFAVFDIGIYTQITRRFLNRTSAEVQAQSVAVSRYVPFAADSDLAQTDTDIRLSGDLPVIDGAAALLPVYAGFVQAVYPPESVVFDGTQYTPDSAMQYTNTRGAWDSLADGTADVILCAAPSQEQQAAAVQHGIDLKLLPVGREAFVFLVNRTNPVDSLTAEEIRGIYTGKYTNWSQLGGQDRRIDAVQRNAGSGSQTTMLKFMGDETMHRDPLAFFGSPIGYSFRYYCTGLSADPDVKLLAVGGVYPDAAHIADGSYPLASAFYAAYDANNTNPNLQKLLDFMVSDAGQRIVSESGYIPAAQEGA